MEEKTDIALDLDALASPNVRISFGGKTIEVVTPELSQYARIIDLGEQFNSAVSDAGTSSKVELYSKLDALVKELVPELSDNRLNVTQITALFRLINTLGMPTDKAVEKLREMGVDMTSGDSPKDSTSSGQ